MKVVVVGTGYVGLVTGTCFAEAGNEVTCVDIDKNKVARLRLGYVPIFEPGLEDLVKKNARDGRLSFTTDLSSVASDANVIFLALPTPPAAEGAADLSAVVKVAKELGPILRGYTVVVNKSTVPIGTATQVAELISGSLHNRATFDVVSNPEFLREGFAIEDFTRPERVVIGSDSEKARKVMKDLYAPFTNKDQPIYYMDQRSSEMTKYAANSFLAMKISFINEIANLCEYIGADIDAVRVAIGADSRIGIKFLRAGIGYGGSCFPKDVLALQQIADLHESDLKMVKAAMSANNHQRRRLVHKLKDRFGDNLSGKTFALWGMAFKPNTDDIREAPSLTIIDELLLAGAKVVAFDPEASENIRHHYKGEERLELVSDPYEALSGAEAVLIATDWHEFRSIDFPRLKKALKNPIIFDGRNMFRPEDLEEHGVDYISIGRGAAMTNLKNPTEL